jgi:integrase
VQETVGKASEGWNKRKAQTALRERLVAVEKESYKRPHPIKFRAFVAEWLETYTQVKELKASTVTGYRVILTSHLLPAFGSVRLTDIGPELIDRYIARKRRTNLKGSTINRHLNLLSLLFSTAIKQGLVRENPVALIDRPREPRNRWRILTPPEVRAVEKAFEELIAEAKGEARLWLQQARVIFLVLVGTGLRRGELRGLKWQHVFLADPEGARLRVTETVVLGRPDTPKSTAGERTIALGQRISGELFNHRSRSAYSGEDEFVFCSPTKGTSFDPQRYGRTFTKALLKAGITEYVRPFHDLRHTSITNSAAAGTPTTALMARAGHADLRTTQGYVDLAGESFRAEADRLEERLWGSVQSSGTKSGEAIRTKPRTKPEPA